MLENIDLEYTHSQGVCNILTYLEVHNTTKRIELRITHIHLNMRTSSSEFDQNMVIRSVGGLRSLDPRILMLYKLNIAIFGHVSKKTE